MCFARAMSTDGAVSLQRKLDSWVEAGLIEPETSVRIMAYERGESRPRAGWAVVALGLLAVVLGALLLISANWDRIADWLKLGVHMGLLLLVAAGFWRSVRREQTWLAEGLLFLFAMLVLGGIALQAQVYQLTGDIWKSLMLWLALVAPVLWLAGSTRLNGTLLALLGVGAPAAMALTTIDDGGLWLLAHGLAMASPLLLLVLAAFVPRDRLPFRLSLVETGSALVLSASSLVHFAWAVDISGSQAIDSLWRLLPVALISVLCFALLRQRPRLLHPALLGPLCVGSVLVAMLALGIPHDDALPSRIIGVLLFMGFWVWVARAAIVAGQHRLFSLAIGALAMRIFIIYLELFGSLAATGSGLLAGGVLLLLLSWAWQRLVRRREKDGEDE